MRIKSTTFIDILIALSRAIFSHGGRHIPLSRHIAGIVFCYVVTLHRFDCGP